jgi:AraC-like DNA-binding protein
MDPVNKALWYIESHFVQPITLDDVACAGRVSRYHMSRVFGVATGRSVTMCETAVDGSGSGSLTSSGLELRAGTCERTGTSGNGSGAKACPAASL